MANALDFVKGFNSAGNDISGIDINYKFPGANTPQGTTGYYVEDPKTGSSAHYYNPSTSKEPYNLGSYGYFLESLKNKQENKIDKQKTLEDSKLESLGWLPNFTLEDGINELISGYNLINKFKNKDFTNL
jgi:hypothetical protein